MTTRRTKRATPRQPAARPAPAQPEGVQAFATVEAVGEAPHIQAAEPASIPRPEMRAERPDMRPPMRTSREEAELRAEQIFANVDLDAEDDKFALPSNLAPDGWEYEWKTYEVIGKRNPGNEVQQARMGWEPVDTARHPEMMPNGYSGAITREGMMLMQRPAVVNERQRRAAYAKAVNQVRDKQVEVGVAPRDQFKRDARVTKITSDFVSPAALKGEGFVGVSHRGGPMPIPE